MLAVFTGLTNTRAYPLPGAANIESISSPIIKLACAAQLNRANACWKNPRWVLPGDDGAATGDIFDTRNKNLYPLLSP